jgi:hypothetical protein
MTRKTTTQFIATALAVASLGFASAAQADDVAQPAMADEAQAAQVDQAAAPETPAVQDQQDQVQDPAQQAQDPTAQGIAVGEIPPGTNPAQPDADQNEEDQDPLNGKEADDRFDRYCHMKDAEPSHSDKDFCEAYTKAHATSTTATTHDDSTSSTDSSDDTWDDSSDDTSYDTTTDTTYETPTYERSSKTTHYTPSSSNSLPFTGLELWQLTLLGLALIAAGLGVRRALR